MGWSKAVDPNERRKRRNVRQRSSRIATRINTAQAIACEACGCTDRHLHRHHPDYAHAERWQTLCVACHAEEHRQHKGVRDLDGLRALVNRIRG